MTSSFRKEINDARISAVARRNPPHRPSEICEHLDTQRTRSSQMSFDVYLNYAPYNPLSLFFFFFFFLSFRGCVGTRSAIVISSYNGES